MAPTSHKLCLLKIPRKTMLLRDGYGLYGTKPCGAFECFPRAVAPKLGALSLTAPLIQIVGDMSLQLQQN